MILVDANIPLENVLAKPEPVLFLCEFLKDSQCRGPLVADAVLATLAVERGAGLCTNDRGFSRFPELRVVNPLE